MPKNVPVEDRLDNHDRALWHVLERLTTLERLRESQEEVIKSLSNRISRLEASTKTMIQQNLRLENMLGDLRFVKDWEGLKDLFQGWVGSKDS